MKLIIDIDPNTVRENPTDTEECFAIWTDVPKAINATLAESICNREDAEIILKALQVKYDKIER